MEFHVQPIDGGLVSGPLVHQLRRGDVVQLASPVGQQLTLPDDGPLPDLLMVAGGTGLAPFRALLQQIDRRFRGNGPAPLVHLFHGARMAWNLYDHKYLSSSRDNLGSTTPPSCPRTRPTRAPRAGRRGGG